MEDWRFINLSADTHPMHVHLQQFQVIDRRPFDAVAYDAALDAYRLRPGAEARRPLDRPGRRPARNERGWKDTAGAGGRGAARAHPLHAPQGAGGTQLFALHCHPRARGQRHDAAVPGPLTHQASDARAAPPARAARVCPTDGRPEPPGARVERVALVQPSPEPAAAGPSALPP